VDIAERRAKIRELWDTGMGQMEIARTIGLLPGAMAREMKALEIPAEERRARATEALRAKSAERAAQHHEDIMAGRVSAPKSRGRQPKAQPAAAPVAAPPPIATGEDQFFPDSIPGGMFDDPAVDSATTGEDVAVSKSAPKLSSYAVVATLPDPVVADIRRQTSAGWEWVATWNPAPRSVIAPGTLPAELQKLAGGGRYAVYVFTLDDLANAKTVITEQVMGAPRLPAHVAAADAQAQATRAQAQMAGAGAAPGFAGVPFTPPPQGPPMWPYQPPPPPYGQPQWGQPPWAAASPPWGWPPPQQPVVVSAPVAPVVPVGLSPEVQELKRQNDTLAAQVAANEKLHREDEMRREFRDGLRQVQEGSSKAIETLGAQLKDVLNRLVDRPATDPSAAIAPMVSIMTAALGAAGEQAKAAAAAATGASDRSFDAVIKMQERQDALLRHSQMQPQGMVDALKASGEMVGMFSKMAMGAIQQALTANNNSEPTWLTPVREAVGQIGAAAQTLIAGSLGMNIPTPDVDEGGGGDAPAIPAAPPQQALPAPAPQVIVVREGAPPNNGAALAGVSAPNASVYGEAAPTAPPVAGGAQAEYIAKLRVGAPDLSAEQIAEALIHIYKELTAWNACYPPLTGLLADPKTAVASIFGDMAAFQDPTRRARLDAAAALIAEARRRNAEAAQVAATPGNGKTRVDATPSPQTDGVDPAAVTPDHEEEEEPAEA